MKKAKLMIGVLTLSAVLLGTGYAAWTDQLTLGTTASTGSLCVKYGELKESKGTTVSGEATVKANVDTDQHKLNFEFGNLAPGNIFVYDTKFKNDGTLIAVLQKITSSLDKTSGIGDNIIVSIEVGKDRIASGDLNTGIHVVPAGIELDAKQEQDVEIKFEVQDDGTHITTDAQGKKTQFTLAFDWAQKGYTAPSSTTP